MKSEQFGFTMFAVQDVKFQQWLKEKNFLNETILLHESMHLKTIFVCRRSNFRWETIAETSASFAYKVKTMACDMPNYDDKIDNVDYKSLKLLN